VSQDEKHLSVEQVECLIETQSNVPGSRGQSELLEEARWHLMTCEACQKLVSMHDEGQRLLNGVAELVGRGPSKACPEYRTLCELAGGVLDREKVETLLNHVVQCDHCGPLLKQTIEAFEAESKPQEEVLIASLKTSQPEWQARLALRLANGGLENRLDRASVGSWADAVRVVIKGWSSWIYAGAGALAVCVIAMTWFLLRSGPGYVDELLAKAYSEQRTLELRMPGAAYAPMRVERAEGRSNVDRPASLLKAESLISENLAGHPDDPAWLQAKGRADLLEGRYSPAIDSLQRALELQPTSASIISDLATAHYLRAEAAERPIDYGTAADLLSKVLKANPNDSVALFNRALTYENLYLYQQAVADWERYLQLDSQSGWANEANRHLATLRGKLKSQGDLEEGLPNDPLAFVAKARSQMEGAPQYAEAHADDYLDLATRIWLPQSTVEQGGSAGENARTKAKLALASLAQLLAHSHSDQWLADMVAHDHSRQFGSAVRELASAMETNKNGQYDLAVEQADRAQKLFKLVGSDAGAMRASFEKVYALDRALHGYDCLRAAIPLAKELKTHQYAWLHVQLLTEEATCRFVTGDMASASREANEAVELARADRYPTLYLRALGNAASFDTVRGDLVESWAKNEQGLKEYWQGRYPTARAFQFYSELSYAAESGEQAHTALALQREAVSAIVPIGNASVEALARYRLADLAKGAGADEEARTQFAAADKMFSTMPRTPTAETYQAAGAIMLAAIEVKSGKLDRALNLLAGVHETLPGVNNFTVPLQFYKTLGDVYLKKNQYEESRRAFRSAINIGEIGLETMENDHERLVWEQEVGDAYRSLARIEFLHNQKPREALEIWEWYRSMSVRAGRRQTIRNGENSGGPQKIDFEKLDAGPPLPELLEVANLLSQLRGVTIISYAEMPDGVAVWVFDDRGLVSRWVTVQNDDLDGRISRFERECADSTSNEDSLKKDGRQLYDWLVAPIAFALDPRRELIVEGDDKIASLAMEALVDRSGEFLGFQFAVTSSPGIGYMTRLRKGEGVSRSSPALVVGTPMLTGDLAGDVAPIPDATREAKTIARSMTDVRLLTGADATLQAIQRLLPKVEVFHFAGHAFYAKERAGLLLAPQQEETSSAGAPTLMSAAALSEDSLQACRLVVLSACSTAKFNTGRDADPNSLVRGFLRAGVPHVVASRWDVDSQQTARFMQLFYSDLFSGNTVSQSLKHVRERFFARRETAHPYYWAAFTAFGRN
jgi:CHAT domain-containing protein/tetratricopeptide (TPR) repeat protein